MRTLVVTPLWPNRLDPNKTPFNAQQFGELAKLGPVRVLNTLLYFPFAGRTGVPKRAAKLAGVPREDVLAGVETVHVRQPYIPIIGNPIAVPLAIASLTPYLEHFRWADVVVGSWAYPDGCASVVLANHAKRPCVVKVHGSDLNFIAHLKAARSVMKNILARADALVAVSRSLADEAAALGVPRTRITVVPNGVDRTRFVPGDKTDARAELGQPVAGRLVLFVGRLEAPKGVTELLDAFEAVHRARPDVRLVLVGEGELAPEVERRRSRLGDALLAPGPRPFAEIARWMTAADVVTLPSWREGTPNVLLEALASGRPCVGSNVGGIPDVLADPRSGVMHDARDAASLATALGTVLDREWPPDEVRACGPGSWADSAALLREVLAHAITRHGPRVQSDFS